MFGLWGGSWHGDSQSKTGGIKSHLAPIAAQEADRVFSPAAGGGWGVHGQSKVLSENAFP